MAGDSLVFTYSGHGTWVPDSDSDEPDGRDEALCPYDIMSGHYLLDDDLAELFALKQSGVRLYFVSDSCHSGTVTRFMPLAAGRGQRGLARPRFLPGGLPEGRPKAHARRVALALRSTRQKYPALLAAACSDPEYSYDCLVQWPAQRGLHLLCPARPEAEPADPQCLDATDPQTSAGGAVPNAAAVRLAGGQRGGDALIPAQTSAGSFGRRAVSLLQWG